MKKNILITISLLLSSLVSFGGGFQLNLQGLRQLAMGGGGAAWTWDASAIFYNPAGLSQLKGAQVYGSALFIIPSTQYASTSGTGYRANSQSQVFTPFNLYVGGTLTNNDRMGIGVGIYTPFGSGLKWDDDWAGRYLIQSISLQAIFVQPTLSYRLTKNISVGGGFVYAFGNYKITQAIPAQDANGKDGQAELSGHANGAGYNVGLHIKVCDQLQIGASYRSKVKMFANDGKAKFRVPASVASDFPNTGVSTTLPLPEVFSAGIGIQVTKAITFTADMNLVGWKCFDSLRFDFDQNTSKLQNQHSPRLYQNKIIYRAGLNVKATEKLAIMVGGAYDPTPIHDGFVSPELPDANRMVLTCGFSFKASNKWTILGALEYVRSQIRDASFDPGMFSGRYQTKAITPGIGITYSF